MDWKKINTLDSELAWKNTMSKGFNLIEIKKRSKHHLKTFGDKNNKWFVIMTKHQYNIGRYPTIVKIDSSKHKFKKNATKFAKDYMRKH